MGLTYYIRNFLLLKKIKNFKVPSTSSRVYPKANNMPCDKLSFIELQMNNFAEIFQVEKFKNYIIKVDREAYGNVVSVYKI